MFACLRETRAASRTHLRVGLTLIEALIGVGIATLLVAIIVPAIQSARARARQLQCASNLHQLGVAIHAYESTWKCLVPDRLSSSPLGSSEVFPSDETEITFAATTAGFLRLLYADLTGARAITSAAGQPWPIVLCPDDAAAWGTNSRTSYAFNRGEPAPYLGGDEYRLDALGVHELPGQPSVMQLANIVDGLSSTAVVAERINTPTAASSSSDPWARGHRVLVNSPTFRDSYLSVIQQCRTPSTIEGPGFGTNWWSGGNGAYTHAREIGGLICIGSIRDSRVRVSPSLCVPAGSRHAGGANVLFVDGHASFMATATDSKLWWALGTRAGGEVVDLP